MKITNSRTTIKTNTPPSHHWYVSECGFMLGFFACVGRFIFAPCQHRWTNACVCVVCLLTIFSRWYVRLTVHSFSFRSFHFICTSFFFSLFLIYATNYEYSMYKHKLYIIQLGVNCAYENTAMQREKNAFSRSWRFIFVER